VAVLLSGWMFVPIAIATGLGILVSLVGFCFVPGPDKALHRTMVVTAVVMMWLLWLVTYMAQMYPITVPQKSESTDVKLFEF